MLIVPRRNIATAGYDPVAQAYFSAVEAADEDALPTPWKDAVNTLVLAQKAKGNWDSFYQLLILGGAKTLAGALVPLVGPAPVALGNVANWGYNRATGLQSGAGNYLDTGIANSAIHRNFRHHAVYLSSIAATTFTAIVGAGFSAAGSITMGFQNATHPVTRCFTALSSPFGTNVPFSPTLFSMARADASRYTARYGGVTSSDILVASADPTTDNIFIFARNSGTGTATSLISARVPFFSQGSFLNQNLLDEDVSVLIAAMAGLA